MAKIRTNLPNHVKSRVTSINKSFFRIIFANDLICNIFFPALIKVVGAEWAWRRKIGFC